MNSSTLLQLFNLLKELRDPKTGCAWTQNQTMASLAPQTIAECYELLDAIASGAAETIRLELGDLLYHLVFYLTLADEKDWFNLDDVAQVTLDKHRQRMPKNRHQLTAEQINAHWQQAKRDASSQTGWLESLPAEQPPLERAYALQSRAAEAGLDGGSGQSTLTKIQHALTEFPNTPNPSVASDAHVEALGELIFDCVNLARHLNIHPSTALAKANQKFTQRFHFMEEQLTHQRTSWPDAKNQETEC